MGLLDIIPGVSEGKVLASGATGLGVGGATGYFFGRRKSKKELEDTQRQATKMLDAANKKTTEIQQQLDAIKNKALKEEEARETREITRISIMTQLALSDGVFCDLEQLYIYNYIIFTPDLCSETKLQLLTELATAKKTKNFFQLFDKHYSSDAIGTTDGELKQFSSVLIELMGVDGKIDKKEQNYLNNIFKSCGLPKLTH